MLVVRPQGRGGNGRNVRCGGGDVPPGRAVHGSRSAAHLVQRTL